MKNFYLFILFGFYWFCSDNLRELCNTFRSLLYELAKCVSVCENNLNATLVEELNKHGILPISPSQVRSDSPTSNEPFDLFIHPSKIVPSAFYLYLMLAAFYHWFVYNNKKKYELEKKYELYLKKNNISY